MQLAVNIALVSYLNATISFVYTRSVKCAYQTIEPTFRNIAIYTVHTMTIDAKKETYFNIQMSFVSEKTS